MWFSVDYIRLLNSNNPQCYPLGVPLSGKYDYLFGANERKIKNLCKIF
jgi:hypothetical protein